MYVSINEVEYLSHANERPETKKMLENCNYKLYLENESNHVFISLCLYQFKYNIFD